MIDRALTYLKDHLKSKINEGFDIVLGSLNRDAQAGGDLILITLVRIEEERSTPSLDIYRFNQDSAGNKTVRTVNPPVILNLYILISAQADFYETALTLISKVISVFQEKKFFCMKDLMQEEYKDIESLSIDLFSPTYEQNNSLWQTLGVKMMPAVMYKVKTVVIASEQTDLKPVSVVLSGKDSEGGILLRTYTDTDKEQHQLESEENKQKRSRKIH